MKWWQLENYPVTAYYPVIVIEDGSPKSLSLNPILRKLGRLSEFTKSSVDSQLGTKLDLRKKTIRFLHNFTFKSAFCLVWFWAKVFWEVGVVKVTKNNARKDTISWSSKPHLEKMVWHAESATDLLMDGWKSEGQHARMNCTALKIQVSLHRAKHGYI